MTKQWRTIGEVCIDSGTIMLCDPCRADEVTDWWNDYCEKTDLNKSPDSVEINGRKEFPIGVVTRTGIGDGRYAVEARYETNPDFGERCAEVRIKTCRIPSTTCRGSGINEL
jgi:hypothetical protein